MLNKKLLQRLTVAGLIAVTTIKRIGIPLLKPDSQMDVVNYTYNFDTKKWGDPTPVKLEKKATPELVMSFCIVKASQYKLTLMIARLL